MATSAGATAAKDDVDLQHCREPVRQHARHAAVRQVQEAGLLTPADDNGLRSDLIPLQGMMLNCDLLQVYSDICMVMPLLRSSTK